jgi:SAM-dependent methyltransferase
MVCSVCGTGFPILEGIPSFSDRSLYWGEIGLEEMRRTNETGVQAGWQAAIDQVVAPLMRDKSTTYFVDDGRADWRLLLPSSIQWRAIDFGAGWGPLTFALAQCCREVVALEGIWERARFIEMRRMQSNISNINVVHADAYRPPFGENTFDLAVVNGLLEWIALWNLDGSPRDVQKSFLGKIHRILKPGGWLYLGIENRVGEEAFRGDLDHSGLPYTMLMPRAFADWYVRRRQREYRTPHRQGYRTYTYSYWGFLRLLRDAGFSSVDAYWPWPSYNNPKHLIPLHNTRAVRFYLSSDYRAQSWRGRLLNTVKVACTYAGASKIFPAGFCFLARRD